MRILIAWISQFLGRNGGMERSLFDLLMRWCDVGILWI